MSNKKIFKELYSEKINKDNNYNQILKSIENNRTKDNIWKPVYIPIASVIVICGLIFININETKDISNENHPNYIKDNNYEITTNESAQNNTNSFTSDIDIKKVDANIKEIMELPNYNFLKEIKIPSDLDNKIYKEIYIKANKKSGYNILYNYDFSYRNTNNDRKIILSFSDKYQPLRDYFYSDNEKKSIINNTEIIVYQINESYITIFTYNNIYFDIETNNITQEELIDLLTSIIK